MAAPHRRAGQRPLMRDDPVVSALTSCVHDKLNQQDPNQIGPITWLLPAEQLGNHRRPAALPGQLATATHHERLKAPQAARSCDFSDPAARQLLPILPGDPPLAFAEIIAGLQYLPDASDLSAPAAQIGGAAPIPAALSDRDVPHNAEPNDTGCELLAWPVVG